MATSSIVYASPATLTFTLASLASDATFIAGRQSAVIDNSSNLYLDMKIGGKITTGTSPTAARQIQIWASETYDGTTYQAGAGAGDANFSPTGELFLMQRVTVIPTDNTSNHTYEWSCGSIAAVFQGQMPIKFCLFIAHNTAVNLNSTGGNHEVKYIGIKYSAA